VDGASKNEFLLKPSRRILARAGADADGTMTSDAQFNVMIPFILWHFISLPDHNHTPIACSSSRQAFRS
jgi:hypothetical protein